MNFDRSAGILLHPTSLPGPYGIGDIGPEAFRWLTFLKDTGCNLWQVLPLAPTGYGDSPYQSFSAFAGNPYIISPQSLLDEGLLFSDDLIEDQYFPPEEVEFGRVIPYKIELLDKAFDNFQRSVSDALNTEFAQFIDEEKFWIEDFALFMAIKEVYGGGPWVDWPAPLRSREPGALSTFQTEYADKIQKHKFRQFVFFRQWFALKQNAAQLGIQVIGDIPIFAAHDSADVWANPELFFMDTNGNPTVVAGVPPDYFSETGQMWGNPLYNWDAHKRSGYTWWKERLKVLLKTVDIIRLDHFRGFAGYWEIPSDAENAMQGQWKRGPGEDFFYAIEDELGDLPILAEDLGEITPDVVQLRDQFDFPGMKIMVFAFDSDASNEFLPHNYTANNVVYTGTHDNDTVLGWYQRVSERERDIARRYLARDGLDISWSLIREAWKSVAMFAISPMQDLLSLDNTARMNYPSRLGGNWQWRMPQNGMNDYIKSRMEEMNLLYKRHGWMEWETEKSEAETPGYFE